MKKSIYKVSENVFHAFKQSGPERKHGILRLFFMADVCTDVFTSCLPTRSVKQSKTRAPVSPIYL